MVTQADLTHLIHPEGREAPEEMTIAPDDKPAPRRRGRPPKAQPKPLGAEVPETKPGKPVKPEPEMPEPGVLAEGIGGFYTFTGMMLLPLRPATGQALVANSEEIGKAWEQAARENPAIRKALLSLMKTTTVGVLVAAHLPVVMIALGESKELKAKRAEDSDTLLPGTFGSPSTVAGIPTGV